jgi:hypothetical protein
VYIVVGEAEAYLCGLEYLAGWIGSGYHVFGVAETIAEANRLYETALQE